jgi:preprotein translocase subunit SecB
MREMNISPLQLDGYFIKDFSLNLGDDFVDQIEFSQLPGYQLLLTKVITHDPLTIDIKFDESWNIQDLKCRYRLQISSANDKNYPYKFKLELWGYFTLNMVPGSVNEEVVANVRVSATSMLYSAAREIIVTLSGRSLYPAIILPAVSFVGAIVEPLPLPNKEQEILPEKKKSKSSTKSRTTSKKAKQKTVK